jgi:hypothetical protein
MYDCRRFHSALGRSQLDLLAQCLAPVLSTLHQMLLLVGPDQLVHVNLEPTSASSSLLSDTSGKRQQGSELCLYTVPSL